MLYWLVLVHTNHTTIELVCGARDVRTQYVVLVFMLSAPALVIVWYRDNEPCPTLYYLSYLTKKKLIYQIWRTLNIKYASILYGKCQCSLLEEKNGKRMTSWNGSRFSIGAGYIQLGPTQSTYWPYDGFYKVNQEKALFFNISSLHANI